MSAPGDGLGRSLLGGLAAGLVALGLIAAAYAVGYDRGQDAGPAPVAATTSTATTTTTAATAPTSSKLSPAQALARGQQLYRSNCVACHALSTAKGVGPGLGGLAGGKVELDDGRTVTADDEYLARSLTDADAQIVSGYKPGIMPAAVAPLHLDQKPDDVAALVAFIKEQG